MIQKIGIFIAVFLLLDISLLNAQQQEVLPKSVSDQISRVENLLRPSVLKQSYALSQIFQKRIESLTDKANFYEEAKMIVEKKFIKHSDEEIDIIITMVLDKSLNQTEKDIIKIASDLQHQNDTIMKLRNCILLLEQVNNGNENSSHSDLISWYNDFFDIDMDIDSVESLEHSQIDLNNKLGEMNDMSEMTSLRLQMTMDRRSKLISTLSHMMKKISTTQDTLVQNIK